MDRNAFKLRILNSFMILGAMLLISCQTTAPQASSPEDNFVADPIRLTNNDLDYYQRTDRMSLKQQEDQKELQGYLFSSTSHRYMSFPAKKKSVYMHANDGSDYYYDGDMTHRRDTRIYQDTTYYPSARFNAYYRDGKSSFGRR